MGKQFLLHWFNVARSTPSSLKRQPHRAFPWCRELSWKVPQRAKSALGPCGWMEEEILHHQKDGRKPINNGRKSPLSSIIPIPFPWYVPIKPMAGWWFQSFLGIFHNLWDVILPIDELHHFSRWWNCTTNQLSIVGSTTVEKLVIWINFHSRGPEMLVYDYWLVVWNMFFSIICGMSSFPLTNSYFSEGSKPPIIELDDGKIYRKPLYLMVKTMVSCRFSLKPIHWTNQVLTVLFFWISLVAEKIHDPRTFHDFPSDFCVEPLDFDDGHPSILWTHTLW